MDVAILDVLLWRRQKIYQGSLLTCQ